MGRGDLRREVGHPTHRWLVGVRERGALHARDRGRLCDRRRDPVLRGFGLVRHRQPPWMGLPDALRVPRFLSLNRTTSPPSPNFLA